ncbi:MAG: NAD-dependent epimerase/dehydratase family protein [Flavobacteriia bacterium]|nr:NAD-dependent epimerase/dehydratase family protein [Flavobacteriia bacterium]
MKILITGGAGFVPSSTADLLLKDPSNFVVLVDNFLTGKVSNIPNHPNCKFIKCDVNNYHDISPIMCSYQFDYVFHYAAVVGVKRTLENPKMVLDDIQGIKNILDLSKNTGVKRVFYSSSSEVYGEPVHLPQNEHTTPLNSRLPYAVVKNVGESYFKSYQQEFGLDYTIFRFFNTYGPKQSTDFVMSKFIRAALKNQDITLYGDGLQTRTFCYIDDNTEACVNAMKNEAFANKIFNIGNDSIITIKELAEIIIRLTNSTSQIVYLPPLEDGDMTRRQPDITKMKSLLNRELKTLEAGIMEVLNAIDCGLVEA